MRIKLPPLNLDSWYQAFSLLNGVVKNERTVILLDEISWMGGKNRDFVGQLKITWDTLFKNHSKLILVLCGSVSSWINKNILNSSGFMGRISLELTPLELDLYQCNKFWGSKSFRIHSKEKLKILAVIGGIPRYLEEINTNLSAEENIKQLSFHKEGILFLEFDRIFNDIFAKRAKTYKKIVKILVNGTKTLDEIISELKTTKGGTISLYLNDLIESGFLSKDVSTRSNQKGRSKLFKFRLKDNYLRFYLKYIEPIRENIQQNMITEIVLENLIHWETVMGYQFENLVLNNVRSLCKLLSINPNTILSAAPYFQRETQRHKACQIDLLIRTKYTLYICEIKFKRQIHNTVITEVQQKCKRISPHQGLSIRPVLIYSGKLQSSVSDGYFDQIISFDDLFLSI